LNLVGDTVFRQESQLNKEDNLVEKFFCLPGSNTIRDRGGLRANILSLSAVSYRKEVVTIKE